MLIPRRVFGPPNYSLDTGISMKLRTTICTFLFVFGVATSIAWSQSQVKWATSLESALEESKSKGKPLLISMHTSTEIACQRMLQNLYTDPEVVSILSDFVVLPTCFDKHAEVEKKIDGKKVTVSPLFGTVGCKNLMANEKEVKETFFEKPDVKVPQHMFVGDEGKVYMSKIFELKKPAFITLLNNALILYGSKAADGMDQVTRGFLKKVKKGSMKDKRRGVHGILDLEDQRKLDILYLTIQSLSKEKEKGECVRAFGKDIYSWAAPTVFKWLRDPSEYVRNCTTVSLEEMSYGEGHDQFMLLWKKEKDKEFKKDILRALGPCGGGAADAKAVLVKNTKHRKESMRNASYLSLGYYLDDEEIQKLFGERYKKEGKSVAAKTAIIWAYTYSRDDDLIGQINGLIAKEKNHSIKYIAAAAINKIKTGQAVTPEEGRSGHIKLHKALGAIFSQDKILRNEYKYWKGED
ncbi:MAG: thioredoxin-related protein [Planctomycetota bacterium]|jgi:thioredoxin-related protein